jgi:hypothetical protein
LRADALTSNRRRTAPEPRHRFDAVGLSQRFAHREDVLRERRFRDIRAGQTLISSSLLTACPRSAPAPGTAERHASSTSRRLIEAAAARLQPKGPNGRRDGSSYIRNARRRNLMPRKSAVKTSRRAGIAEP